jgi:hypothetical protein
MFDNIGGKIKGLAVAACVVGIISSIIIAIVLFAEEEIGFGFLYLIIGSLVSWISSFGLYGFGHLIETTENIEYYLSTKKEENYTLSKLAAKNEIYDNSWVCGVCGRKNKLEAPYCNGCGHKK